MIALALSSPEHQSELRSCDNRASKSQARVCKFLGSYRPGCVSRILAKQNHRSGKMVSVQDVVIYPLFILGNAFVEFTGLWRVLLKVTQVKNNRSKISIHKNTHLQL